LHLGLNALLTIYNTSTASDFFEQFEIRIATPLKMEHFRLQDTKYYFEEYVSRHPAYLFRMSALDLAKFGLLYLRTGNWAGEQLLPAKWVSASREKYTVFDPRKPHSGYGYMWWVLEEVYYAAGTGGQRLFILPEDDLVIVHRTDTPATYFLTTYR
jgi:CubicO group peptidase (beta-lactamase class C family)